MTAYRAAEPDDEQFVVSGWSSSYRMSRDLAFVQMANYADVMHPVIRSVLARPRTRAIVAHGPELLRGFIAFELSELGNPPLIHYLYVAAPFRGWKIARGLFAAAGIDPQARWEYAARTMTSWEILERARKAPLATYNPYRARYAEERRSHR